MSILVLIAVAAALAVLALLVRSRHRATWAEIFRLRGELDAMRTQVVAARKEAVLARVADSMRLPPRMPSQNGEDLALWDLFDRKREGFYVEVGAYDGVGFSNTYFFEAIGWTGVLVEAAPELYARCTASRPYSTAVHAACGAADGTVPFTVVRGEQGVATLSSMTPDRARIEREGGRVEVVDVPLRRLDDILAAVTGPIDFVSIDVEGAEIDVLSGFDLERFRPRVLVIEDNSNGADTRVRDWLAERGYAPSFQLEQNVCYTQRSPDAQQDRS